MERTGSSLIARTCILACLLLIAAQANAQLPGFTQTGNNWTYAVAGQPTITGILHTPSGTGPFPAVIISHGYGGAATGFSRTKAYEMVTWGYVCIGPDYNEGGNYVSDIESLRRARACLDILESLSTVDDARISAYGNSMGAFGTIRLCNNEPTRVRAAAITAGGIFSASEAQNIVTPFLILHGSSDGTVPPALSALLETTLDQRSIINERILYPGVGHNLHNDRAAEVYTEIHDWFNLYNVPAPVTAVKSWEHY